jgi:hypothetical protein
VCGNQRYCGLGKPDPPSCVTTLPAPSGPPHANVAERPTVTGDCPRAFAHCPAFPSPGCPPWGKAMASGPRRYLGAVGSASASHARVQNSLGRAKHSNLGGLATTAAQGRCSPRGGALPHRRWAHAGDPLLAARGAPQECRARRLKCKGGVHFPSLRRLGRAKQRSQPGGITACPQQTPARPQWERRPDSRPCAAP